MNINETFKQLKEEIIAQSDDSKTAVDILLDKIEYLLCESDNKDKHIAELEAQLQRYQELQDDGLLHVAPCADGTKIWYRLYGDNAKVYVYPDNYRFRETEYCHGNKNIGWFFTEEEAQQALENRK